MSRVQAMLAFQPARFDDDPPTPAPNGDGPHDDRPGKGADKPHPNRAPRQRRGALLRLVRQREVSQPTSWRPWWLLGLLEVVTHPLPRFLAGPVLYVPGVRAYAEFPARPPMFIPVAA